MGAAKPPSPRRASTTMVVTPDGGRPRLYYDGKAAPWPLVVRPAMRGVPVLGQRLAEAWRENA